MKRSAKPGSGPAAPDRLAASSVDEIEGEFLGIWLDLARLGEKLLALLSRLESRRSMRGIKSPAGTAATSRSAPCSP